MNRIKTLMGVAALPALILAGEIAGTTDAANSGTVGSYDYIVADSVAYCCVPDSMVVEEDCEDDSVACANYDERYLSEEERYFRHMGIEYPLADANDMARMGQYDALISRADQVLQFLPTSNEAYGIKAIGLASKKQYKALTKLIDEYIAMPEKIGVHSSTIYKDVNPGVLYALGLSYGGADYEKELLKNVKTLERNTGDAKSKRQLAYLYEGLAIFYNLDDKGAEFIKHDNAKALDYARKREAMIPRERLKDLKSLDNGEIRTLRMMIQLMQYLDLYSDIEEYIERNLSEENRYEDVYLKALLYQEKYGKARDLLLEQLNSGLDVYYTCRRLGTIGLVNKDYAEAEKWFQKNAYIDESTATEFDKYMQKYSILDYGVFLHQLGRKDELAKLLSREGLDFDDTNEEEYYYLEALKGHRLEALRMMNVIPMEDSRWTVWARLYMLLGDTENALACIERAYEQGSMSPHEVKLDLWLHPLAKHPRHQEIEKKYNKKV